MHFFASPEQFYETFRFRVNSWCLVVQRKNMSLSIPTSFANSCQCLISFVMDFSFFLVHSLSFTPGFLFLDFRLLVPCCLFPCLTGSKSIYMLGNHNENLKGGLGSGVTDQGRTESDAPVEYAATTRDTPSSYPIRCYVQHFFPAFVFKNAARPEEGDRRKKTKTTTRTRI